MIRYALACDKGHVFESWFQNSAAYERQVKAALITCPVCNSAKVEKTLMAPGVVGAKKRGAPPPAPEWGRMISESREFLPEAWWSALAPGLAIFLVVMGFNLLGDGLRDILDPRIRRGITGR